MRARALVSAGAAALVGMAALTGCSSADADKKSDKPTVVTSTNVYADIVRTIAGDAVDVEPIIDSTSQDPHSYEATSQDRLKVKKADLIVENGGGYDAFMDDLGKDSSAKKINAVELSGLPGSEDADHDHEHGDHEHGDHEEGHHHGEGSFNEHVWYSPEAMEKLEEGIVRQLSELDADHTSDFEKRGGELKDRLSALKQRAEELGGKGRSYLATEPVPGYLLETAGLKDATPADFYEAIEGDTDAPASVVKSMRDRLESDDIALLGFNSQTESAQTKELKNYADQHGVATVSFTETLPSGKDYVGWMNDNLDQIQKALGSSS